MKFFAEQVSQEERRFLQVFHEKAHKKGSDGWLLPNEAAQEAKIAVGHEISLADGLTARDYLKYRQYDGKYHIAPRGEDIFLPWFHRKPNILILLAITVLAGLIVAGICRLIQKFVLN